MTHDPILDADLLQALTAAHADAPPAEPVPPALAARLKHRLFERIADAERRHVTVQASEDTWQPFHGGVDIKVLHESPDGIMSYLLRLAPGAKMAPHRHPVDEDCVVLQGSVRIGADLLVLAGGFHLALKDTLHASISSDDGAVIYLRGASPHPADLV